MASGPLTPASPISWHSSMKPEFPTLGVTYSSAVNSDLLLSQSFTVIICRMFTMPSPAWLLVIWLFCHLFCEALLLSFPPDTSLILLFSHCIVVTACLFVRPLLPSSDYGFSMFPVPIVRGLGNGRIKRHAGQSIIRADYTGISGLFKNY